MKKIDISKLKKKLKNWDENVLFHGATLNSFFRPKMTKKQRKIECWIKELIMITSFYLDNRMKDKDFFVSTTAIHEKLLKYGNTYCRRTVEKGLKLLENMGLITIEPFPATEQEMLLNPQKTHSRRRKLIPNLEKIFEYLCVYDEDDELLKSLPDKHPLKKLVYKRPYSYVKNIEKKYAEYTTKGEKKPYSNSAEMHIYWCLKYSKKYFNVSQLVNKYMPNNLQNNLQERIDEAYISKASPYGVLDSDQIVYLQDGKGYLEAEDYLAFIGWKVSNEDIKYLEPLGYSINPKGFITGWNKPQTEYKAQGWELL